MSPDQTTSPDTLPQSSIPSRITLDLIQLDPPREDLIPPTVMARPLRLEIRPSWLEIERRVRPVRPLSLEVRRPWIQLEPVMPISLEPKPQVAAVAVAIVPSEMTLQQLQLRDWQLSLIDDPPVPTEWTSEWLTPPEPEIPTLAPAPLTFIPSERIPEPQFPGLTQQVENLPPLLQELQEATLPLAVGNTNETNWTQEGPLAAMSKKKSSKTAVSAPKPLAEDFQIAESHAQREAETAIETSETPSIPEATEPDLDEASLDWKSDVEIHSNAEVPVAFIADPYQMNRLEVSAAQNDDEFLPEGEELDLEDSEDESEGQPLELLTNEDEINDTLKNLENRLQAAQNDDQQLAAEAALTEAKAEEDAKALLAAQIQEDQELEKAMREEAEQELETDPELLAALPKQPEEDENGNLDLSELQSCIEALLFMVEKPMSAKKLHELLGPEMPLHLFQEALTQLKSRYQRLHHGFELVEIAGGYQFRTKPARSALAKKLAKIQTQRLSTGAMETLAIIAYKQPVMKEDVDKIRGVDSSHFIRGLLDRKLIKISGRSELPGRPMLYMTTTEFMEVFSLKSLEDLPPLKEIESMVPGSQSGTGDEDPRVKTLRALVGEMKADTSVSLLYDPKEDEKFLSDIREKVQGISITTPTLTQQVEEQKAREKAIKEGLIDPHAEANVEAMNSVAPGETPDLPLG